MHILKHYMHVMQTQACNNVQCQESILQPGSSTGKDNIALQQLMC